MLLSALLAGLVAGSRALLAPTAASLAASFGFLDVSDGWLAFLGYHWTPWILSLACLGELVNDKLPATPSRKVPPQLGARLVMGTLAGAAFAGDSWHLGAPLGIVGALVGTFAGAAVRGSMAKAFGKDLPAALMEDLVAIVLAVMLAATAGHFIA